MRRRGLLGLAIALGSLASAAQASVILQINGSGQLTGATGVVVNGTTYNVTFVDGTCAAAFGGCTSNADFQFTTSSEAAAAAQAMLDQVFTDSVLGQFDSNPALTFGCNDSTICASLIPFAGDNSNLLGATALNGAVTDDIGGFATSPGPDTSGEDGSNSVYAVFTVPSSVPEPSTWAMMLLGFGAIGAAARRRKRLLAAAA